MGEYILSAGKERTITHPSEVDINTGKQCSLAPSAITLQMRLSWYIAAGTIVSSSQVAFLRTSTLLSTSFGCKIK
jgi:hypothetical protein